MPETKNYYVGLDVGGTSVKMGLFTEDGELLAKHSVPTPPLIDAAGYAAVTGGIEQLVGKASVAILDVKGIGAAIPCPVPADGNDPETDVVLCEQGWATVSPVRVYLNDDALWSRLKEVRF